jgi:adenylate cyclase
LSFSIATSNGKTHPPFRIGGSVPVPRICTPNFAIDAANPDRCIGISFAQTPSPTMPVEIERKFLVTSDGWQAGSIPVKIVQGYLSRDPDRIVRVRLQGDQAFLTVKGRSAVITRAEIEFPIPIETGRDLLPLCLAPMIQKTRHEVIVGAHKWEVDEFHGENVGLVVAEIELESEEEIFQRPSWIGLEVSLDHRYTNSYLSEHPFSVWGSAA